MGLCYILIIKSTQTKEDIQPKFHLRTEAQSFNYVFQGCQSKAELPVYSRLQIGICSFYNTKKEGLST